MGYITYGFVEKDMYDAEECSVEVFKTEEKAIEAMKNKAYKDIGVFVRDLGYAPIVRENKENNQITIINCCEEEFMILSANNEEIPRTDYRVIEIHVND